MAFSSELIIRVKYRTAFIPFFLPSPFLPFIFNFFQLFFLFQPFYLYIIIFTIYKKKKKKMEQPFHRFLCIFSIFIHNHFSIIYRRKILQPAILRMIKLLIISYKRNQGGNTLSMIKIIMIIIMGVSEIIIMDTKIKISLAQTH